MAISQIEREIGARIEAAIKSRGVRKGDVAEVIDLDGGQFSRMLNGKSGVSIEVILAVSSKFDISLEWLLLGSGTMEKEKSGPSMVPDQLLTQIQEHANAILLSLQELKPVPPSAFQRGTNVIPGSAQKAKTSDKKKTSKKQEGS